MSLSNAQYEEIMHEYNRRQLHTLDVLEARTQEVLAKVPEYRRYSNEISLVSVEAAKARIKGESVKDISLTIDSLEKKRTMAMTDAGFPKDYLSPVYVCRDCQDTGFIGNTKCHCFKQAEINLLYSQSNINNVLSRENFDNFDINLFSDKPLPGGKRSPRDCMLQAVSICREFINNFPSGQNLLFLGEPGVGKTFLSNCIAKELLDHAHSVLYLSAIELFEYFSSKNDIYDNSGLDNSINSMQIIDCDLLIIDDLGTELTNAFTNSRLFYCINQRIITERSTIISTNLSISELMHTYSERIFSRIVNSSKCIELIGDDIRFRK